MTADLWLGLTLTLVAGLLSGNCMLPLRFVRRWAWENTWLVFSIVSLFVLPWLLGLTQVSGLGQVYSALPASAFAAPAAFGAGWGVAQVLFGLTIARLGLALGYALIVGLGALLGTLVPLIATNRDLLRTQRGLLVLAGMAVMVAGIAVSAWAGAEREQREERERGSGTSEANYGRALVLAVVCGLLAPMLNYAFAFGQSIAEEAVAQGARRELAGYAVWPVALFGGLIPNTAYSMWLLTRHGTWSRYRDPWLPDVALGSLMGVLWMGAFAIYGVSSVYLGRLGTSVGWALFQTFMIMTATLSGVVTGEWATAPAGAKRRLWIGLALLASATAVIAASNRA